MNNEKEYQVEASPTTPNPQKVHLVKPPKKLNEMTEQELRAYAMALGEAFKKKQAQLKQEDAK
jgi:hypothetical protein